MKCEYCGEESWSGMMHKANCPKGVEIERRNMETLSQIDQMVSAEAQTVEKLKGQNEELRKALEQAIEAFNWLGDIINNTDIATPEDEEYTTPRIKFAREVLNQTKGR